DRVEDAYVFALEARRAIVLRGIGDFVLAVLRHLLYSMGKTGRHPWRSNAAGQDSGWQRPGSSAKWDYWPGTWKTSPRAQAKASFPSYDRSWEGEAITVVREERVPAPDLPEGVAKHAQQAVNILRKAEQRVARITRDQKEKTSRFAAYERQVRAAHAEEEKRYLATQEKLSAELQEAMQQQAEARDAVAHTMEALFSGGGAMDTTETTTSDQGSWEHLLQRAPPPSAATTLEPELLEVLRQYKSGNLTLRGPPRLSPANFGPAAPLTGAPAPVRAAPVQHVPEPPTGRPPTYGMSSPNAAAERAAPYPPASPTVRAGNLDGTVKTDAKPLLTEVPLKQGPLPSTVPQQATAHPTPVPEPVPLPVPPDVGPGTSPLSDMLQAKRREARKAAAPFGGKCSAEEQPMPPVVNTEGDGAGKPGALIDDDGDGDELDSAELHSASPGYTFFDGMADWWVCGELELLGLSSLSCSIPSVNAYSWEFVFVLRCLESFRSLQCVIPSHWCHAFFCAGEVVADIIGALALDDFLYGIVPFFFTLQVPDSATLEEVTHAVRIIGKLPGKDLDVLLPVSNQRHFCALSFIAFPSIIHQVQPSLRAIILDLTRVGGHYYADTVPALLSLEAFFELIGRHIWRDTDEVDLWIDAADVPATHGDLAFTSGSVFTVLLKGLPPDRVFSAREVLAPGVEWGPFEQTPSPRQSVGEAIVDRNRSFHLPYSMLTPLSLSQSARKALKLLPYERLLHTDIHLYLDVSSNHCHTVYTGPAQSCPWLLDLRPLGFSTRVLFRDFEPTIQDILEVLPCTLPDLVTLSVQCLTPHEQRSTYLPVVLVTAVFDGLLDATLPGAASLVASDLAQNCVASAPASLAASGPVETKNPSEATTALQAAVSQVAGTPHVALLPEPFHRIGDYPPDSPLHAQVEGDDDVDTEEADRALLVTVLLFSQEHTQEEVRLRLHIPCTVEDVTRQLLDECDEHRYALFPHHVPADPQPSQWWLAFIAQPAWAGEEPTILLNLTAIDGRCFVASAPNPFSRAQIFRLVQLPDDGTYDIFPFWRFTPMQEDDTVAVIPCGTVTIVRSGGRHVVHGHGIDTMLLGGTMWLAEPELPSPPVSNRCLLVQGHGHDVLQPLSGAAVPTSDEVSIACGVAGSPVHVVEATQLVRDAVHRGFPCSRIFGVAFPTAADVEHDSINLYVTFIDCRPLLQGWIVEISSDGRLRHSDLTEWLETFAPVGWQVQITGAPIEQGYLETANGDILVAEYVPETSSEGVSDVQSPSRPPSDEGSESSDSSSDSGSDLPGDAPQPHFASNTSSLPSQDRHRSRSPSRHSHGHACSFSYLAVQDSHAACLWPLLGLVAVIAWLAAFVICTVISFAARGSSGSPFHPVRHLLLTLLLLPQVVASPLLEPVLGFGRFAAALVYVLTELTLRLSCLSCVVVAKLLSEPQARDTAGLYVLAGLRLVARRLGPPWRYLSGPSAVHFADDSDPETEGVDEDAPVRWVHFMVLAVGFTPELITVALRFPATLDETLQNVTGSRAPGRVRAFPCLIAASPQPLSGLGVLVALPSWSFDTFSPRVMVCIDTTAIDGRIFAAITPAHVMCRQLQLIADLPPNLCVSIFVGLAVEPLPGEAWCHLCSGDTISFYPEEQARLPPLSLSHLLLRVAGWRHTPDLPHARSDHTYCLVSVDGSILHFANPRRPTAYRDHIAAAIGTRVERLHLFPAVPLVSDAVIDGIQCRTVLAVCEFDSPPPPLTFGVILDLRALLLGWCLLRAVSGHIRCREVLAQVQEGKCLCLNFLCLSLLLVFAGPGYKRPHLYTVILHHLHLMKTYFMGSPMPLPQILRQVVTGELVTIVPVGIRAVLFLSLLVQGATVQVFTLADDTLPTDVTADEAGFMWNAVSFDPARSSGPQQDTPVARFDFDAVPTFAPFKSAISGYATECPLRTPAQVGRVQPRCLPTPCRAGIFRVHTLVSDDDFADLDACLVLGFTLLEASVQTPESEAFLLASTLLDTLQEYQGAIAGKSAAYHLSLGTLLPLTAFQAEAIALEDTIPQPVRAVDYWRGTVSDWLDTDLTHLYADPTIPAGWREVFASLPLYTCITDPANVIGVVIYTDGSADARHAGDITLAAWSFAVWFQTETQLYFAGCSAHSTVPLRTPFSLGESDETPFTAELLAIAWSLVWALEFGAGLGVPIEIRYDCTSAGGCAFAGMRAPSCRSPDGQWTVPGFTGFLRQALELRVPVFHRHVAGHKGDVGNELCDRLAKFARKHPEDFFDRCLPLWPHEWWNSSLAQWGWMAGFSGPELPRLSALEAEARRMRAVQFSPCPPDLGVTQVQRAATTLLFQFTVLSYNVLTMYDPKAPKGKQQRTGDIGLMIAGKREVLKRQLLDRQVWLAGFQETRLHTSATLPDGDFIMLNVAANSAGQYGCALWINKQYVYATHGNTKHRITTDQVTITSCSERAKILMSRVFGKPGLETFCNVLKVGAESENWVSTGHGLLQAMILSSIVSPSRGSLLRAYHEFGVTLRPYRLPERLFVIIWLLILNFVIRNLPARDSLTYKPVLWPWFNEWLRAMDYCIATIVELIRESSTAIRAAVRRDRNAYLESLVAEVTTHDMRHPKQLYAAVRKAFPAARSSRRTAFQPLPAVLMADGSMAQSQADRASRWIEFFGEQEAGRKVDAQEYQLAFSDPDIPVRTPEQPFTVASLPALQELEQQLLSAKYGKACGPDGLTAEVFRLSVPRGSLHCLAKRASAALECAGYRSILMASTAGKAHHRILRDKLMPHFQATRSPLQFGQVPGVGVEGVAHIVRTYQCLMQHRRRVCAVTFYDVKAAFYQVLRQALIPGEAGFTDTKLLGLLHGLGVPDHALSELLQHLHTIAALPSVCDDEHLTAQIADLFRGSWFRLDGSSDLVLTRRGTRPGDPLADLLFGFLFSAYLRSVDHALAQEELETFVPQPQHPQDGTAPFHVSAPQCLGCMAWADDFAHLQSSKDCATLCDRVVRATGLLVTHATAHGMVLTFAPDKSAVLLCHACDRSPNGFLVHDQHGALGLKVFDAIAQVWHFLPVVDSYRHLGTIAVANAKPGPEISFRTAKAQAALKPLRRKLFSNPTIALPVRRNLLRALVVSKFVFSSCAIILQVEQAPHSYQVLHAPSQSWLGQFAVDVQAVTSLVSAPELSAGRKGPVEVVLEGLHAEPAWWLGKIKTAIRLFSEEVQAWVNMRADGLAQPSSPPVPSDDEELLPYVCEHCSARFRLRKHVAAHAAKAHGVTSPTRHYAFVIAPMTIAEADKYFVSILTKSLESSTDKRSVRRGISLVEAFIDQQKEDVDEIVFNSLLNVLGQTGDMVKLQQTLNKMNDYGVAPSAVTFGTVVKAYGRARDTDSVIKVWHQMRSRCLGINPVTCGCVLDACVKCNSLDKAMAIFQEMRMQGMHKNTVLYATLIKGLAKMRDLQGAMNLYHEMRMEQVPCNLVTFNSLMDVCVRCSDLQTAAYFLQDMMQMGIEPDLITFSTLIKGYSQIGQVHKALALWKELKARNLKCDEIMYNSLIDGCAKSQKFLG
ncbi:PPR4, partial [Symbiodinium sp. KB8]